MKKSEAGLPATLVPGVLLLLTYVAIAIKSRQFKLANAQFPDGVLPIDKPIPEMLGYFALAFAFYLWAVFSAVRAGRQVRLGAILGYAIAFRAVILFSTPILELDIYRYIWDGNASAAGVNPYKFSPEIVRDTKDTYNRDLKALVQLSKSSESLGKILRTVHFEQLPSPYPPVSQAVFGLAAATTPDNAPVSTHLWVMKFWIVIFDLGTLWLLMRLLALLRKPAGWAIAYGWCPLVLKEFANSGHLDSITVFFTVAAAYSLVAALHRNQPNMGVLVSAALLACATAGKFYPLILTPVFFVMWRRKNLLPDTSTASVAQALGGLGCYLLVTTALLFPMFYPTTPAEDKQSKAAGFKEFMRSWEMNDFLFMVVIENLKPDESLSPGQVSWLQVTPSQFRTRVVDNIARRMSPEPEEPNAEESDPEDLRQLKSGIPFLLTRLFTSVLFGSIVLWMCVKLWRESSGTLFLETTFLVLAVFWFLAPTQNPWYWTWAVAFVPFARNKGWLAVSGLTLVYYLRFWFQAHFSGIEVAGTGYAGTAFFDHVVTCIEFGPWLVIMLLAQVYRRLVAPGSDAKVSEKPIDLR